jgi:hypothetical protein
MLILDDRRDASARDTTEPGTLSPKRKDQLNVSRGARGWRLEP